MHPGELPHAAEIETSMTLEKFNFGYCGFGTCRIYVNRNDRETQLRDTLSSLPRVTDNGDLRGLIVG